MAILLIRSVKVCYYVRNHQITFNSTLFDLRTELQQKYTVEAISFSVDINEIPKKLHYTIPFDKTTFCKGYCAFVSTTNASCKYFDTFSITI